MESQTPTNKTPLILGIISIVIVIIPFLGTLAGLALGIVAFIGGKKAMAEANARPDRAGIGVAITGKWLGFGGMLQSAFILAYTLLALLISLAR